MPKYWAQKDEYSCGPTAILNLLKWLGIKEFLGHKVNGKLVNKILKSLCKCNRDGTYPNNLIRVIRTISGIRVVWITKRLIPRLREHLSNGGVAIVSYTLTDFSYPGEVYDHFAFVLPGPEETYNIANGFCDKKTRKAIARSLLTDKEEIKWFEEGIKDVWLIYRQS